MQLAPRVGGTVGEGASKRAFLKISSIPRDAEFDGKTCERDGRSFSDDMFKYGQLRWVHNILKFEAARRGQQRLGKYKLVAKSRLPSYCQASMCRVDARKKLGVQHTCGALR